jgi:hypothetical protein
MIRWKRMTIAAGWLSIGALAALGCGPRMTVVTSTSLGLHATPGDGNTQPPQVSLAYKRSEVAVIPTGAGGGHRAPEPKSGEEGEEAKNKPVDSDLFSALTAFGFQTTWFGKTALNSVIATGHAARDIASGGQASGTQAEAPAQPAPGAKPPAADAHTMGVKPPGGKAPAPIEEKATPGQAANKSSVNAFVTALKSVTR